MKWLIILGVAIIAITYLYIHYKKSTLSVKYKHVQGQVMFFDFKFQETDTLTQRVTIKANSVKKYDGLPIYMQVAFRGQRKDAEKVLSLNLKLYPKNEKTGLYDQEIPIKKTFSSINFSFYEYETYGIGRENYTEELYKLIYPSDINKPETLNRLMIDHQLDFGENFPKEIKAIITIKWIGGEKEFSTLLVSEEWHPSGIRTNPFG